MRNRIQAMVMALATLLAVLAISPAATTQPRIDPDDAPSGPRAAKLLGKVRGKLLRKKVGLSEEKAQEVERIFGEHQEQRRAIQRDLRQANKQLRELTRADSDDQEAYAAALGALEAASKDLEKLRDGELAALKQILTPKEQAKLLKAMQLVRRRLNARMRGRE